MPNLETHTYTLPSGATIEFENLPGKERGARDVSSRDKNKPDAVCGPVDLLALQADHDPLHPLARG